MVTTGSPVAQGPHPSLFPKVRVRFLHRTGMGPSDASSRQAGRQARVEPVLADLKNLKQYDISSPEN